MRTKKGKQKDWPDLEVELRPGEIAYRFGTGKDQGILLPDRGVILRRDGTLDQVPPVALELMVYFFKNPRRCIPNEELEEVIAAAEEKLKQKLKIN
jgi:hypothetical protein